MPSGNSSLLNCSLISMKKILTKILLILSLLVLLPQLALAFAPFDPGATDNMNTYVKDVIDNNFNPATDGSSVYIIVGQVIKVFLGLLGTIFVLLLVISGYNWLTAAGDSGKITKAQGTIRTAIIGLVIILAAYIIAYFVFSAIPDGIPR